MLPRNPICALSLSLFLRTQFDTIDNSVSLPRRDHPPPDVDAGGSAEAAEDLLVGQLPQPQLARVPDPGGRVQLCGELTGLPHCKNA